MPTEQEAAALQHQVGSFVAGPWLPAMSSSPRGEIILYTIVWCTGEGLACTDFGSYRVEASTACLEGECLLGACPMKVFVLTHTFVGTALSIWHKTSVHVTCVEEVGFTALVSFCVLRRKGWG